MSDRIFPAVKIAVLLLIGPMAVPVCLADTIYLKSGKVYEGKVTGKSNRRYVFTVDMDGEKIPLSFFIEEIDKVDLSKDSAEAQIPFLKEIETFQVPNKDKTKTYESSVYNKDQKLTLSESIADPQIRQKLTPEEFEYYQRFNEVVKRYNDKLVAIENIYLDLTNATKEEFAVAKKDMDEFYFDLNSLFVPDAFKKAHKTYLESVKSTYLVFNALEAGMLEEASRQIKMAEESKEKALGEFRQILTDRPIREVLVDKKPEGAAPAGDKPAPAGDNQAKASTPS